MLGKSLLITSNHSKHIKYYKHIIQRKQNKNKNEKKKEKRKKKTKWKNVKKSAFSGWVFVAKWVHLGYPCQGIFVRFRWLINFMSLNLGNWHTDQQSNKIKVTVMRCTQSPNYILLDQTETISSAETIFRIYEKSSKNNHSSMNYLFQWIWE